MLRTKAHGLALLAGSVTAVAWAGGAAAQLRPAERPTNLPGVTTSAAPPAHFDALNANDADLSTYGFPPRPNVARDPANYASWAAAVAAERQRIIPRLQQTEVYHGPRIAPAFDGVAVDTTSSNWSGFAVQTGATTWALTAASSFNSVSSNFVVPAASTRSCDSNWEYSSVWVGIDGYSSSDVLQAGVEADASCTLGATQTYYSPWYEWYPNASTRITNLSAAAGQSFFVHVWATTATVGHAYVENLNLGTSVSINFTAPKGTTLRGDSAEWILESPSVSGSLATLPIYGLGYFATASGKTGSGVFYKPSTAGAYQINLTRNGKTYSATSLLGTGAVLLTSQ